MRTQIFFVLQLFLVTAFVFSCGEDDEKKLSFKDQDAQGKMFGTSWTYADGSATLTERDGQEAFGVTLYAAFDDDLCKGEGNETGDDEVGFTVPRTIGLYKLKDDPDFPMLHVAMRNVESGDVTVYAYEGSIEILTISETMLTGRVVAKKGEHSINGNFEVPFCVIPEGEPLLVKSH